jgi:hypothetical protein
MLASLVLPVLMACFPPAAVEPDGSRTLGVVPPFRAEPAPPGWLRAASHVLASACAPLTRHYVYEAYAGGGGQWLVRYRPLPGAGEDPAPSEQAFLFESDPLAQPCRLEPCDLEFTPRNARLHSQYFTLVDRRDLVRGRSPAVVWPPPD